MAATAATALATLAVCLLVLQPLGPPVNDPDSAASVLYFQQIVSGHRLEAMVVTTPKPLLTVLYGLSWQLTHDWRALTLETIAAFTAAVCLASRLAHRLAGPAAAAFIVVGLLAWPEVLTQVAHANSLAWAFVGWLAAGLALTAPRPRPWLAGVALLIAGLARVETLWLVGAVGAGVALMAARATRERRWDLVRSTAATVLLGALAVPVMCAHDWLLSGQPLYSWGVPASYTAMVYPGLRPMALRDFWSNVVWPHYSTGLPALAFAAVGLVRLAVVRRWAVLAGLVALAGGVALTLAVLSQRGVYISGRYWEEADAPILLAAAIGAAFLIDGLARCRRVPPGGPEGTNRFRPTILLASGGVLSLAVAWPALTHTDIAGPLATARAASVHLAAVSDRLVPILRGATGRVMSLPGVELPVVDPGSATLLVPREDLPRIAVEMGAPFEALGDNYLAFRSTTPESVLSPGQWVLHETAADRRDGVDLVSLEVSTPTPLGRITVVPVVGDAAGGVWLLRIEGPAGS